MRSLKILTASFAALALASCGGGTTGEAPKGDAVAAVAPASVEAESVGEHPTASAAIAGSSH